MPKKMIDYSKEYVEKVVPNTASDGQKRDIEQAFMAGMYQMQLHMQSISINNDEEVATKELEANNQELISYIMNIVNSVN